MTKPGRPQRERVVLAHRRGTRVVHTRVEVQEQTEIGDALVRGLVRAQLGLALRLAALVAGAMAALPLINAVFPELSNASVFGIRLNWLTLAVLVYPALYAIGRLFIRLAEQGERDFMGVVDEVPDVAGPATPGSPP
ncbi:hypothetical protein FHT40_005415 [Mycolicibacterium sp. BK556]|uniref:hypothetical protein n=1 Tax=unclassified Mycolicibacterium TaxID=2636767 RepID=UPI0016196B15|nr:MULTISPECIES: hypothetical protein [unclassified Mycolicibacterium]MBB3605728.1 hypothetical protein [Mycolicibacterium sp. BK556]MBB3635775.1 hypothetical protein [Mycolicibacterium sp. BK607]